LIEDFAQNVTSVHKQLITSGSRNVFFVRRVVTIDIESKNSVRLPRTNYNGNERKLVSGSTRLSVGRWIIRTHDNSIRGYHSAWGPRDTEAFVPYLWITTPRYRPLAPRTIVSKGFLSFKAYRPNPISDRILVILILSMIVM